ncbi:MAG: ImmA/IrrE family metallo-endopeptidase [Polyangiaceae bacterium]
MSRKRSERAVAAAHDLLASLRAAGPEDLDVELIAMDKGAHVEWLPLTNEDAHVRRIGEQLFIGLAERSRTSKKWRYDLAHEIGHLYLHGVAEAVSCPSVALRRGEATEEERKKYWKTEGEANDFASELMLARSFLEPLVEVPPHVPFALDEVQTIADRFDMSLTSTGIRCTELAKDVACAFTKSVDGQVEWHAMSDAFRGKIVKGRPIGAGALARALGEDGERVDGMVDGGAWGNRAVRGMREQSLRGGGVVLTWLWHPGI